MLPVTVVLISSLLFSSVAYSSVDDWSQVPEKTSSTPEIPKLIWTFWNTEEVPFFVQKCVDNMQRMNPNYNLTLVKESTIKDYISAKRPVNFDDLMPAYKADWLRVALLQEHGGIWVDSSTVVLQSFDFVHDLQKGAEGMAFYFEPYNKLYPKFPVIENWFFASIKGSDFMTKLLKESTFLFENFPRKGDRGYTDHLAKHFGAEVRDNIVQNLGDSIYYLRQHVAMQYVMQVVGAKPFATYSATSVPYGPFSVHSACSFNNECIIDSLWKEKNPNIAYPAMIKLVAENRELAVDRLLVGLVPHPNSIFFTLLEMTEPMEVRNNWPNVWLIVSFPLALLIIVVVAVLIIKRRRRLKA